jgi:putative transposase
MSKYYRENHSKYIIKCHLIFVCKYRKHLLFGSLDMHMKQIMLDISTKSDFDIEVMETDKNYIFIS